MPAASINEGAAPIGVSITGYTNSSPAIRPYASTTPQDVDGLPISYSNKSPINDPAGAKVYANSTGTDSAAAPKSIAGIPTYINDNAAPRVYLNSVWDNSLPAPIGSFTSNQNPISGGAFTDPETGQAFYDPETGQQFTDPEAS